MSMRLHLMVALMVGCSLEAARQLRKRAGGSLAEPGGSAGHHAGQSERTDTNIASLRQVRQKQHHNAAAAVEPVRLSTRPARCPREIR